VSQELTQFVRAALEKGAGREQIRAALMQSGWPTDEIDDALARYADVDFPVPVPVRRTSGSAGEAFLYLVTFFLLYTWAVSLGNLLAGLVDRLIPETNNEFNWYASGDDSMRWLVASIAVSFPAWYLLTSSHLRSYAHDPERRASPVRRWLTYLTLFVAATVLVVTLIVLVAGSLGGDYFLRTALKSAIVLALAGGVFFFYRWELRMGDKQQGGGR